MKTYVIDFEFRPIQGSLPHVWCVAWICMDDHTSGNLWLDGEPVLSPFGNEFRMIAHYAMAELSCFDALGWSRPCEVIDTLAEARAHWGQTLPGWRMLDVAHACGILTMSHEHKDQMRSLALEENIAPQDRQTLMNYCAHDVQTTEAIWRYLEPGTSLPYALIRGRYLLALSRVENHGIPVDMALVSKIESTWDIISTEASAEARVTYPGVIRTDGSFSSNGWNEWCTSNGIYWPYLPTGSPALDADTFKQMSERYPEIAVMADARKLKSQHKRFQFPLGHDSRLRCMLSPFGSDTGRNQPPNSKFIFGTSAWLRSVIKAPKDKVLAYVDYSSQEFALAGGLSHDSAMMEDYHSGDPYIAFATRTGALPPGANKRSHPVIRTTYKLVALSVQYGMGAYSLAERLGCDRSEAEYLIDQHKAAYPQYWRWRESVIDEVTFGNAISTPYGWTRRLRTNDKPTSIANFPVQAAGAEVLRIAITALVEAGHMVIAPVHDAVLVELDSTNWRNELHKVQALMSKASMAVAPDVEVRTDVELVMPGQHFVDGRGKSFWKIVERVIGANPTSERIA